MTTVGDILHIAASRINRLDARVLLAHQLECPKESFITHPDRKLTALEAQTYLGAVDKVADGYPVPYLTGLQAFWGHSFFVTPDVLIPRPDTETLVETAIAKLKTIHHPQVLDLGTGSGCIAISLALEFPQANVTATDVSEAALHLAERNADYLGAKNVQFTLSSWFDAVPPIKTYDVIVSNPPYIHPEDEHLPALRFEPLDALTDHNDGLSCLRVIIDGARKRLKDGGALMLEHGYDQGASTRDLLLDAGFIDVVTIQDLGGNDRVSVGCMPANVHPLS